MDLQEIDFEAAEVGQCLIQRWAFVNMAINFLVPYTTGTRLSDYEPLNNARVCATRVFRRSVTLSAQFSIASSLQCADIRHCSWLQTITLFLLSLTRMSAAAGRRTIPRTNSARQLDHNGALHAKYKQWSIITPGKGKSTPWWCRQQAPKKRR
jgi:hypothetical protein